MKTVLNNRLAILLAGLGAMLAVFACAGEEAGTERPATTPAPTIAGASEAAEEAPAGLTHKPDVPEAEKGIGMLFEPKGTVIRATPTPEPTGTVVVSTPTPTPPLRTVDEEITGVLIDLLAGDEYPRTSARQIVNDYRDDPVAAEAKYRGKFPVIQGTVKEAGRDPDGAAWVAFSAGKGELRCIFEKITEAELSRLTPGGTNATTGSLEEFDPETLRVTAKDCRIILGY